MATRGGLIPVYKNKVCLMKSSDPKFGGSDWQFAKGMIDEGETPIQAAIREGKEELGISVKQDAAKLLWSDKRSKIDWFFVEVDSDTIGEYGYETGDVKWFEYEKALETVRKIHLPVLKVLGRRMGF